MIWGCMGHDTPFYAGVFSCVLGLPKNFGEFGGVILSPVFKALVMVIETGFELRVTITIIIVGSVA